MRQRISNQFCRGAQIELFHNLGLMKFDGSGRNFEEDSDVLGRSALSQ